MPCFLLHNMSKVAADLRSRRFGALAGLLEECQFASLRKLAVGNIGHLHHSISSLLCRPGASCSVHKPTREHETQRT